MRIRQAVASSAFFGVILSLAVSCSPAPTPSPVPPTASVTPTVSPVPTLTVTPSPTPTATPTPQPKLCSPLTVQRLDKISEIITQPLVMPRVMDDGSYKDDGHHGVDLGYYTRDGKLFTGSPVLAALDGKIAAVIHNRPPYGDMIMLETPFERIPAYVITSQSIPAGDSLYTLYAHRQNQQPLELEIGQAIHCGQQLAETGLTGFTGGPHLHFETRWGPAGTTCPSIAY
ncbi:MAG: M23 family metallopeptidase [Chloroflexi bacterium]|nr:M23 family metallopeptidase [Chloroflexota bacterium]